MIAITNHLDSLMPGAMEVTDENLDKIPVVVQEAMTRFKLNNAEEITKFIELAYWTLKRNARGAPAKKQYSYQ